MRGVSCSVLFLALAGLASSAVPAAKNLPPAWPKCRKDDPRIGECLRDATHTALRDLSERGVRELGVLPVDPLHITHLHLGQGEGPVSLQLEFNDIDVIGFKNARLTQPFQTELDKVVRLRAPVSVGKKITLKGQYKARGQVLVLPVNGEGNCEVILDDPKGMLDITARYITKNGVTYAEVTKFDWTFDVSRARFSFENLVKGNKQLSSHLDQVINENWMAILEDLKPGIQDAFAKVFKDVLNRIFLKVPFRMLWK